ncbi:MAG: helix-turn-helix transcriptional regulator [Prochloraceae cyanobacterium]|nr:helix-turn-helix transcriptional regulator [Prochloraceae cyanobacterium]
MGLEERKKKFVALLEELLKKWNYTQAQLAKQLGVSPSSLTRWLQGKIDPAALETLVFTRIAQVINLPTDSLVKSLQILEANQAPRDSSDRFTDFVEEMLAGQSQEQLGNRLGVSQKTISTWINSEQKIDPGKMPISTIALLAKEKSWTVERLLGYLGLKEQPENEADLLAQIQSQTIRLSFPSQVKLQIWFSREFENNLKKLDTQTLTQTKSNIFNDRTPLIILEEENITIASRYTADLIINLQINPDNIQVTTIPKLPQSLDNIDVLIFDISTADSPSIALIEEIDFKGNILVFADPDLSQEIIGRISNRVTEVLLKPIDWNELKARVYFS